MPLPPIANRWAGLLPSARAVAIALIFLGSGSVAELAEETGLNKITVRRAVAALEREGFLVLDGSDFRGSRYLAGGGLSPASA